MSLLEICKICLSRERNLFLLNQSEISLFKFYKIKFKINLDKVCWECKAVINNFCKLQLTALKSAQLLRQYAKRPSKLHTRSSLLKKQLIIISINPHQYLNNEEIIERESCLYSIKKEIKEDEEDIDNTEEIYFNNDNDSNISLIDNEKIYWDDIEKKEIEIEVNNGNVKDEIDNNIRDKVDTKPLTIKEFDIKVDIEREGYDNYNLLESSDNVKVNNIKDMNIEVNTNNEEEIDKCNSFEDNDSKNNETLESKRFTIKKFDEVKMLEYRENLRCKLLKSNVQFRCDSCISGFKSKENYDMHVDKYHRCIQGTNYMCDICSIYFSTNGKILENHISAHYIAYQCTKCPELLRAKTSAHKHFRLKHLGGIAQFNCTRCNMGFRNESSLNKHIASKHNTADCSVCGKSLKDKYSLRNHMLLHTGMPTFQCHICNKTYRGKSGLRIHMNNIHTNKNPENAYCAECGLQFRTVNIYKQHLLGSKHRSEKLTCDICKKMFIGKNNLRRHINYVHTKKSNNKCYICGKLFVGVVKLQAHIDYVHKKLSKPKIAECTICNKMFTSKHILKNHINVHTGDRPFRCPTCPDSFGSSGALYNHRRLVHERQKHKPN